LVLVRLTVAATRGKAGKARFDERACEALTGDYDGAMFAVRRSVAELEAARSHGAAPEAFRQAHVRIDDALARAATAAADVHTALFDLAGGVHHAEVDPDVIRWKVRLNAALTLRSQHLMAQVDEEAARPIAGADAGNRAAYGPHQAGLDFDTADPGDGAGIGDGADPAGADRVETNGAADKPVVLDLDAGLKQTTAGSTT
jgi:hypothetical protein